MIAETLIPARFCIAAIDAENKDTPPGQQAEQEKASLATWQDEILIGGGQSRNPLLEERDRQLNTDYIASLKLKLLHLC